ncbi:hypothetical protein HA402_013476 [Bradysia odoriphaga]|nr:hypothetical protein HA402_013476 [Bradysia odoriphaga]
MDSIIVEDLKICLRKKEQEIKELQKKVVMNERPEPKGEDIVKFIHFHMPMLTENQISLMTKQKQRVNWTNEELSKGFTSAFFSQRCHGYWINDLQIPLPAVRTLNRYAARMVIAPGMLHDVLIMLEGYVAHLPDEERQVILSFDEMACKALVKYHRGLDQVFGPNKEMQVVMVRGIRSKFKQPIYINFDTAMSKDILFEALTCLHRIGLNVAAVVSDCGGSNVGLWKQLNITCSRHHTNNFFLHPVTGRKVYLFADAPHMLKLLRNWFLDYGFVLQDGTVIKKDKIYDLLHVVNTEISPAFKLSDLHFDCKDTERMNVALAAELFSHTTATCLRRYFPNDVEAIKLANFLEMVNY